MRGRKLVGFAVHHLECFGTWNKKIIPLRGRKLCQALHRLRIHFDRMNKKESP